jgi:tetratricopeptide (TPR) repeat protein
MTAIIQTLMQKRATHWVLPSLFCALLLALGPAPTLAQDNGGSSKKQKLNQLKKEYATFQKAGKQENYQTAYSSLAEAVRLAEELEQSGALSKLRGFQQNLPTKWGNEAIENKNYEMALTHFEKGAEWSPDDAYVHYGKGLALVNLDSTQTGLETLQKAVEVGNRTGNTRVVGLAEQRIRDEFLAKASKALNSRNPTNAQADSALSALDQMQQYVDPNAQSLFYRARAQYEKGSYEQAVSSAQQGLEMHQGSRSDAAKYYFIVAESQLKLGNKSTACQTFQNATYGDYKARAEHYLKNECQD